jgi:hypothetical protein
MATTTKAFQFVLPQWSVAVPTTEVQEDIHQASIWSVIITVRDVNVYEKRNIKKNHLRRLYSTMHVEPVHLQWCFLPSDLQYSSPYDLPSASQHVMPWLQLEVA